MIPCEPLADVWYRVSQIQYIFLKGSFSFRPFWVQENIIIIGELSETYQRPIGDQYAWSETYMPDRRSIGERHARLETIGDYRRTTCLIRDKHAWSENDPGQDMYFLCVSDEAWRSLMGLQWGMSVSNGSPMRHVGLQCVSAEECWSPMRQVSLRWGVSVSNEVCRSPMRCVGLRSGKWVSN